jgi:heme-degrading monooxygenase HmoA
MFIAMNRFKVIRGSEAAFENVWLSRDSRLERVPGFVEFSPSERPRSRRSHALRVTRALGADQL